MNMDPGQLDRRVAFQSFVMIEDDMGGVAHGWEDRFTLWAALLRNSASGVSCPFPR